MRLRWFLIGATSVIFSILVAWFWPKRPVRPLNEGRVVYDVTEDEDGLHYIPRS